MQTKIAKVDAERPDEKIIEEAGKIIKEGGLVAFPTETVYGLGGNALDPEASQKIYAAKGRPSDNPLIVHIAEIGALDKIARDIPESALRLAERFWPGPLTMIFNKTGIVPCKTTGGLDTVAVRMPDHPVALALIKASGGYIAAPSANTSGRPSTTKASHVWDDLNGKIPMILDAGEVRIGLESTIIDFTEEIPAILRPGYINKEMLEDVLGEVRMDPGLSSEDPNVRPKAPGMRYRHYAPKAQMTVVEGPEEAVISRIIELAEEAAAKEAAVKETAANEPAGSGIDEPPSVALLVSAETAASYEAGLKDKTAEGKILIRSVGHMSSEEEIAHNLFSVFRDFDDLGVKVIYSEAFDSPRLGDAIMNRLLKAAGHTVEQV